MKRSQKKSKLEEIFESFKTDANFDMTIDKDFITKPKEMVKKYEEAFGFELTPTLYHPVEVHWSMKGTGFGSFSFYVEDGKLHCSNEMMGKDFVKAMLCLLVEKAIFDDDEETEFNELEGG